MQQWRGKHLTCIWKESLKVTKSNIKEVIINRKRALPAFLFYILCINKVLPAFLNAAAATAALAQYFFIHR